MWSLPSLVPQDSYSLWYTSSTSSNYSQQHDSSNPPDQAHASNQGQNASSPHHRRPLGRHRLPLTRLRLDEEYMDRRKKNIQNYGNSWIKPPGIPKSLHQLRDEKREIEEHQEALRREQLAQELAEAEADGAEAILHVEEIDGEVDEARDLDDDIPEANATGLGSDDHEDEDDEDDDENDEVEGQRNPASRNPMMATREARERALLRGDVGGADAFDDEVGSTTDDLDQSQMLQEEDLVHEVTGGNDMDMDMGADLDADIPEAENEGYEHTDTEEELTSSDDESVDSGRLPPSGTRATASMVRSDGTQNSLDLSSIISNASSQVGSSPQQRLNMRGRGR